MSEKRLYHTKREYLGLAFNYQPSEKMSRLLSSAREEKKPALYTLAKERVDKINHGVVLPTEAFIRSYQVKKEMFLNPLTQIQDNSPHNLHHATATEILASHIASVLNADADFVREHGSLDVVAQAIAGSVHDTKRLFNSVESALNLTAHATKAAQQIDGLTHLMGQDVSEATKKTAAEVITYHDTPVVPQEHNTGALQAFKLADGLGMVRFILHQSRISPVNNLALQTVEDKLLTYDFDNPFVAKLLDTYAPIALALYSLSDEYMAKLKQDNQVDSEMMKSKQYQVESVILAAKDLGLLAK